jgi:hypothetical protein
MYKPLIVGLSLVPFVCVALMGCAQRSPYDTCIPALPRKIFFKI